MSIKIEDSWKTVLKDEFKKDYFLKMTNFLQQAKKENKTVFPLGSQIFNAFNTTPFQQVKAVILGQDPYHKPRQAMGLSFSVPNGVKVPPSLVNIYKELADDVGFKRPNHGDLSAWASQGVFLLNAMLTVEKSQAGSHKDIGWQNFTDAAIHALSEQREHLVFILWGSFAQKKKVLIDADKHLILQSPHPSPLSSYRGFFGCKHFSQTNAYLKANRKEEIDWNLESSRNLFS